MRRERFDFTNPNGDRLSAALELPDFPHHAVALFAHCFTCSKDILAAARVSRALVTHGLAVLRFDFTGLGESAGDFSSTSFSSNIEDLTAAARALEAAQMSPELLIGHSLGGAAVLAAAGHIASSKAVVTIGAPAEPKHVRRLLQDEEGKIERDGNATVLLAERTFQIKKQFLDDLTHHKVVDRVAQLGRALLVMHSPRDEIVEIEQARLIYQAAKHPKSFVSLDDADHLLTRPEDALYAGETIAAWASRYLGATSARPTPPSDRSEFDVAVQTAFGKFAQTVWSGRHTLASDEPLASGGFDAGPAPYDLLLASLGSCTSMTIKMYADRKQWPLESVSVKLSHRKVAVEVDVGTGADSEKRPKKIDSIEKRIALTGPLSSEQKARLIEMADRCPVHRTLSSSASIEIKTLDVSTKG